MAFDFADAKRRFENSRKLHPAVIDELIEAHEEALGLLREIAARSNACPSCGSPGHSHARGCRLERLLGSR